MKLREVIRLKKSGVSNLAIGKALALSRTTVVKYLGIIQHQLLQQGYQPQEPKPERKSS